MTDAKELIERLRFLARFEHASRRPAEEAADWIERWAPVEAIARRARQATIEFRKNEKSAAAEIRAKQLNAALFATLEAALGEDKP